MRRRAKQAKILLKQAALPKWKKQHPKGTISHHSNIPHSLNGTPLGPNILQKLSHHPLLCVTELTIIVNFLLEQKGLGPEGRVLGQSFGMGFLGE